MHIQWHCGELEKTIINNENAIYIYYDKMNLILKIV